MAREVGKARNCVTGIMAAAVCAAALVCTGPAAAQVQNGLSADELEKILGDAGMTFQTLEDAGSGSAVLQAEANGIVFWIRALDCGNDGCSTLLFFANFELGRSAGPADYQAINRFNEQQVFGRAYIIDARNEVGVDYVIEMDGGVSMDNVTGNVGRWVDVIGTFIDHFRESSSGS